ncbi:MAG: hypothetical protein K0R39_2269, partial [Symbiobacteriaceae bacterium]|nr:hypothetical protein [Symbiobacteriaceae bacterium]
MLNGIGKYFYKRGIGMSKRIQKGTAWVAILLILWGINLWGPVLSVAEAAPSITEAILFSEGNVGYRMKPDGTGLEKVLSNLGAVPKRALPVPDGSGDLMSLTSLGKLYRTPLDGQPITDLTIAGHTYTNFAFLPNGSKFAFTARSGGPTGSTKLYTSNSDGSGLTAVYTGISPLLMDWGTAGLLYTDPPALGPSQPTPLYVIQPDGSGRTLLSPSTWFVMDAKFSHDASKIAVVTSESAGSVNKQLWVMNADGTNRTRLTTNVHPNSVTWSPADDQLAVTGIWNNKEGEYGVFTLPATGSDATQRFTISQTADNPATVTNYVFWGGVAELKTPTTLTVSSTTTVVGNTATLTAVLDPALAGKLVTFTVGGVAAGSASTDATGTATVTYSTAALSAGNHTIQANYAGDSGTQASSGTATLTLQPVPTGLNVPTASTSYGGTATLTATLTPALAGKTITFSVAGTVVGSAVTDAAGVASLSYVTTQNAGNHTLTAAFAGETNYAGSTGSGILVISKAATTVTTADTSATFQGPATVQATLSPALAGQAISFFVDGGLVGSGTTNGSGVATVSFTVTQAGGPHTLSAAFGGNANYQASGGSAIFTVNPASGTLSVADVATPFKSPVTLSAALTPGVSGKAVTFTVGSTTVGTVGTNATGTASITYSSTESAGTYTITASFPGDASVNSASDTGTLTVTQATGSMSVSPASGTYLGSTTLRATLSPAAAGKSVAFTVGGSPAGTALTDATGVATVPYTISAGAGTHTIAAAFGGDSDIAAVSGTGTLTVNPAFGSMNVDSASGAYGESVTLSATLSPAVAGKSIVFSVNGTAVGTGTTDASGHATAPYTITQGAGGHTLTATFAGDSNISFATNSTSLTVTTATGTVTVGPASTTYRNSVTLTATLSPAISGRSIVFSVDGSVVGSGTTNASGTATFTYTPLNTVGSYPISATWGGDSHVGTATGAGTLAINQASGIVTVSAAAGTYYHNTSLSASLSPAVAGKTLSFAVDGVPAGTAVTNASGIAAVPYHITNSVGPHTITVQFAGDPEIAGATGTGSLTVAQANGVVTVAPATGPFGGSVTLQATLAPGVSGKSISFAVNGVPAGTVLTDGSGVATVTYTITNQAGTYPVTASFAGDPDIAGANGSGTLTVEAAAGSMTVSNVSGPFMSGVTLQANLSPAAALKSITFKVGGVDAGTALTNAAGVATLPYTITRSVGTHTIEASFAGDPDISSVSATGNLTVTQATGDLTVSNPNGAVGTPVTMTATLVPGVAGKVIEFSVDGTVVGTDTTDASGVATFDYTPLKSVGDYPILVSFAGDSDIAGDTGTGTLTVTQGTGVVTVAAKTGTYMGSVVLEATLSPALAGKWVEFKVGSTVIGTSQTNTSGVATLTHNPITQGAGNHTITATFVTDADLTGDDGSGTLTVNKATGVMLTADKAGNYGQTVTLEATLTPGVAGKTVTFLVNGISVGTDTTDGSGLATFDYNITVPAGNHTITATFAGDADIMAVSDGAQLVVSAAPGTLTVPNQAGIYRGSVTLTATLSPALAGKTIVFEVDGVVVGNDDTDGTGLASVTYTPITNSVASYQIRASFAGDGQVGNTVGTGTLDVAQATGVVTVDTVTGTYKSTVTLTATLAPGVIGKTITFTVNGADAGFGTTDAAGKVTVSYPIDLSVSSYIIMATFAGDGNISGASGSANLNVTQATGEVTVADRTAVIGQAITLEATLSPAVTGKPVAFSVNGSFVGNGTTDAFGLATFNYTPLLSVGDYPITAVFAGDSDIAADTGTGTLSVTPATGAMVADDVSATYWNTVTLRATLSPALAGKLVTFSVDGTVVGTGTTLASGVATYGYQTKVGAGTHTILASWAGDGDISSASDTSTLTVAQATGDLTVSSPSGAVGTPVTMTATLVPGVAGKVVEFSVDGTVVGTDTTDASGVATFDYTPLKAVGPYT